MLDTQKYDNATYDFGPMRAEVLRHSGDDLAVVNAARQSFGKRSTYNEDGSLKKGDISLLNFLADGIRSKEFHQMVMDMHSQHLEMHSDLAQGHDFDDMPAYDRIVEMLHAWRAVDAHDTPFNHVSVTVAIMVPLHIARQLVKHEYMPWSEMSRRYIDDCWWFHRPGLSDGVAWRYAPEQDVKQGSGHDMTPEDAAVAKQLLMRNTKVAFDNFIECKKLGMATEQARQFMPLNMMVEVTWSGFLGAFAKMLRQRLGLHAQQEAQVLAKMLREQVEPLFPHALPALLKGV